MIKNGSKPGRNQVETSNFWDLFRYFWDLFLFLGPIKTLDLCHLHLDSPGGDSLSVIPPGKKSPQEKKFSQDFIFEKKKKIEEINEK